MKWNKRGVIAVSALTLFLVGGAAIRPALAYFTTYTETTGGMTLALTPDTEIEEEVNDMEKYIRIRNTGTEAVWVRVKLFYPDGWTVGQTEGANILWFSGDSDRDAASDTELNGVWTYDGSDQYWYYSEKLPVEMLTKVLHVTVTPPKNYKGDFDVIVVYEYTAAVKDGGSADWDSTVSSNNPDSGSSNTADAPDGTAVDSAPVSGAAA